MEVASHFSEFEIKFWTFLLPLAARATAVKKSALQCKHPMLEVMDLQQYFNVNTPSCNPLYIPSRSPHARIPKMIRPPCNLALDKTISDAKLQFPRFFSCEETAKLQATPLPTPLIPIVILPSVPIPELPSVKECVIEASKKKTGNGNDL